MQTLSETYARERSKLVHSKTIAYHLHLTVNEGSEFEGSVEILFEAGKLGRKDIYLDYSGKEIKKLRVNGKTVSSIEWNGTFIRLKRQFLLEGAVNTVEVHFKSTYANDGCGLHSFIDPVDSKQYIYSQCEAYFANRIFPNFDQPDIKAQLFLTATFPSSWIFIGNMPIQSTKQQVENSSTSVAKFFPTPFISTYLFAFIAGPFHQISYTSLSQDIPMKLFCRQTQSPYLHKLKSFIFAVTSAGISFFEHFFKFNFPFKKYDQIFCAEFNAGAMENVGAVTFTDEYLFKEDVDSQQLGRFANTILHELAHMWFGNLVTMTWWNDLWLNESFADFISHYCLSQISVAGYESISKDAWVQFSMRKSWGYREDQMTTTHAIASKVENTEVARSIFDGITYAKGASTLKQLMFMVGEDTFSKALAWYFEKHQFGNATLDDLFESFKRFNKLAFEAPDWQSQWINTAGLNVCEPLFVTESSYRSLKIVQSAALQAHSTLRRHKMKIGFFGENGEVHVSSFYLLPQIDTVIKYEDVPFEPQAILLNYDDQSFIKVILDRKSFTFFKNNLHLIKDQLTRTLVWRSLFEMARDARLTSEEYLEIFKKQIVNEESEAIITNQFAYMVSVLRNYTPHEFIDELYESMRQFTRQFIQDHIDSPNIRAGLRQYLTVLSKSEQSILDAELSAAAKLDESLLLHGENGLKAADLLPTLSSLATVVSASEHRNRDCKRRFFENYILSDPKSFNSRVVSKCLVLDFKQKECEYLWETFVQHPQIKSLKVQENLMTAFNTNNQFPLFNELWLRSLDGIFANHSREYASLFYDALFPRRQNPRSLIVELKAKLESISKNSNPKKQTQFLLKKKLTQSIDDLNRQIVAHNHFYNSQAQKIKPRL